MELKSVHYRNKTGRWKQGGPVVEAVNRKLSRTIYETKYVFEMDGRIYKLIVPAGYVFDGASIPWIAWSLLRLSPHGIMDGPSLPHDFIYEHQGKMPEGSFFIQSAKDKGEWWACSVPITRSQSDALLKSAVTFYDAAEGRRAMEIWLAVRAFGWWDWRRNDTQRKTKKIKETT